MFERLRKQVPQWVREARWHASDVAWFANWRAIRAIATPWARPSYEAARAKLFAGARPGPGDAALAAGGARPDNATQAAAGARPGDAAQAASGPGARPGDAAEAGRGHAVRAAGGGHGGAATAVPVIERALVERWLADAAPPEVPFDAVILETSALRTRFGDGPRERRSLHMHGKLRMTHRAIPTQSVLVLALFSDVAADYFVETMAADVAAKIDARYGAGTAFADTQASVPVLLKETAVAAGLGTIGKNALFFSRKFGFNCKLNVIFLNAAVDHYDAVPTTSEWKLPDCSTCNLCVEACPVGAFDDYVITRTESCDRLIAGDFFGPRRDHMCRACITRCPVSNDVLKVKRSEGVPKRAFWDNEAQMSLVSDLFMYRPSILVWILQRFYYGSELPGRIVDKKKGYVDSLTAAMTTTTSDKTRDGWRLAAKKLAAKKREP